ncbi:DUF2235 domain-containing protein [Vibrio sp. S9_S30]|uniref:phospholipase effector Tle1 domain-containing protein n=1 Tax=Vibrio sp. S9_S30 TaxID=2720226 RepID=UPI0016804E35|nr:DUF2235 domain-containing protein [Vibrio sp. S9_S30]MBD1557852.1 DUF2235 domain-containing protein [Vibrio sp. S9_S30]
MSTLAYCAPCEKESNWIEIVVRDEHNQPFSGIKGKLVEATGVEHRITLSEKPILVKNLQNGRVTIELEHESWLKEAQKRTRRESDESEVLKEWLGTEGYSNSCFQYLQGTVSDLVSLEQTQNEKRLSSYNYLTGRIKYIETYAYKEEQKRNKLIRDLGRFKHHKKGSQNNIHLEVNNSYAIEIKGFNFLSLRIGMFFDGTLNNSYSATWGKQQFEKYYPIWKSFYLVEGNKNPTYLSPRSLKYPDALEPGTSAENEHTNIQKLFDLYLDGEFLDHDLVERVYITGIGTSNDIDIARPAEESKLGYATGTGDFGIEKKVETGIDSLLEHIQFNWSRYTTEYGVDGLGCLKFDVLGFSRGAAAARHFVNTVHENTNIPFFSLLDKACTEKRIPLKIGFNGKEDTAIKFVGIFDTVAAVVNGWSVRNGFDISADNTDNGDVKLWLDPERIEQVVHLVADSQTEYRLNFTLNQLNDNHSPHFSEYTLPGAHSDLGGGYHSRLGFSKKDYLLPRMEKKALRKVKIFGTTKERSENKALARLKAFKNIENALGWGDVFKHELRTQPVYDKYGLIIMGYKTTGTLYIQRAVEGDLSRLYLRLMVGLAQFHNAPFIFDEYLLEDDALLAVEDHRIANLSFKEICQQCYTLAKDSGKVLPLLNQNQAFKQALISGGLVHHSSDVASVAYGAIVPNQPNNGLIRKVLPTRKGY